STCAPSRASVTAIALPRPREEARTRARLPVMPRSMGLSFFRFAWGSRPAIGRLAPIEEILRVERRLDRPGCGAPGGVAIGQIGAAFLLPDAVFRREAAAEFGDAAIDRILDGVAPFRFRRAGT